MVLVGVSFIAEPNTTVWQLGKLPSFGTARENFGSPGCYVLKYLNDILFYES